MIPNSQGRIRCCLTINNNMKEDCSEGNLVDYTTDAKKDFVDCDYCYSEMNLDAPTKYNQGCGNHSISSEKVDLEVGQCKIVKNENKPDTIHGIYPKPYRNTNSIFCSCNNKVICNGMIIKPHGSQIPLEFNRLTKSVDSKCCQSATSTTEAIAKVCKKAKRQKGTDCLFIHNPKTNQFYQDILDIKKTTEIEELFKNVKGETNRCVWIPQKDIKKAKSLPKSTSIQNAVKVLETSIVLCTCKGNLCNKYVALAKTNRNFQDPQPTDPPQPTTTPNSLPALTTKDKSPGSTKPKDPPPPLSASTTMAIPPATTSSMPENPKSKTTERPNSGSMKQAPSVMILFVYIINTIFLG